MQPALEQCDVMIAMISTTFCHCIAVKCWLLQSPEEASTQGKFAKAPSIPHLVHCSYSAGYVSTTPLASCFAWLSAHADGRCT